ncbi:MAG: deoxyribose-phosphate aldolase, partial [Ilumatobacteraceae bacterium]
MANDDEHLDRSVAERVIALIDATNLADDCTDDDVIELCRSATGSETDGGPTAAVCVYPQFVELARRELPSEVLVATVVNFPGGDDAVNQVVAETEAALAAGADEIDVVMPYRAFLEDGVDEAAAMIDAVRAAIDGDHALKVIIESGAMSDRAQVDAASRLAVDHGADFVKTSTGKIDVSATPEAAETILGVLSTADRPVGIKVAGGVRSLDDAAEYLALADRIMGDGWASPATFRFGSSSLLTTARMAVTTDQPDAPTEPDVGNEPATSTGSASDESHAGNDSATRDEGSASDESHAARDGSEADVEPATSAADEPATSTGSASDEPDA